MPCWTTAGSCSLTSLCRISTSWAAAFLSAIVEIRLTPKSQDYAEEKGASVLRPLR